MSKTSPDIPGTWEHGDPGKPVRSPYPGWWSMAGAAIHITHDPAGPTGELLWHLSISRPHRHPSWDDIKAARYRLLPLDRDFAIILPTPDEYVNVVEQDHVFHVWEIFDVRRVGDNAITLPGAAPVIVRNEGPWA